ncbi:MAG: hypothetical protein WB611_33855 [Stellaceae bacterium]
MRLWISAHNLFGVVVMIAKLCTHSPAGDFQFFHTPASAMMPVTGERQRIRMFPGRVFFHS